MAGAFSQNTLGPKAFFPSITDISGVVSIVCSGINIVSDNITILSLNCNLNIASRLNIANDSGNIIFYDNSNSKTAIPQQPSIPDASLSDPVSSQNAILALLRNYNLIAP
jgi:hypothetical protein